MYIYNIILYVNINFSWTKIQHIHHTKFINIIYFSHSNAISKFKYMSNNNYCVILKDNISISPNVFNMMHSYKSIYIIYL